MATEWYYAKQQNCLGPVSDDQMRWLAANRELLPSDLIWKKGMAAWAPASVVGDFFLEPKYEWYFANLGGTIVGPLTWGELCQMADGGRVQPHTFVWREGTEDWKRAGEVQGLCNTPGT